MQIFSYIFFPCLTILLNFFIYDCSYIFADIKFEDVSKASGINRSATSFGASWGDFNGDGWPDLWVGNHGQKPSLYLNQKNGKFVDIASTVCGSKELYDAHGAAWADFDNDGDQDLIELVGAKRGKGIGPNRMFVNEKGAFREMATSLGLDQPYGRGRTPIWFDADRDGQLDIALLNLLRQDGKAPSGLFLQTPSGFIQNNDRFKFFQPITQLPKQTLINKLVNFVIYHTSEIFFVKSPATTYRYGGYAQLADLSGDNNMDFVTYPPIRINTLHNLPSEDITRNNRFPLINHVQDVAIEDFNGDLKMDIYLARRINEGSDVINNRPYEIRGKLYNHEWLTTPIEVQFQAEGDVSFSFEMNTLPSILVGSKGYQPEKRNFTLSSEDMYFTEKGFVEVETGKVLIEYNHSNLLWKLSTAIKKLNFVIKSSTPITIVNSRGYEPTLGKLVDRLLIRHDDSFKFKSLRGQEGALNACNSIVAADFDNDMDIDLYLVCTGFVENLPNILYENQGDGEFIVVPKAGGALGSNLGRGESVVTADFDRDGFMDLFVTNGEGSYLFKEETPHQLFRNQGNKNHWIEIDLQGVVSNSDGIGSRIILEVDGISQIRENRGGMHRTSQNHKRIHFGLGKHTKVDKVIIYWPSGIVQEIDNIDADQILRVEESR